MSNVCIQVKIYDIHNHYYQKDSRNCQNTTKRRTISLNNNMNFLKNNQKSFLKPNPEQKSFQMLPILRSNKKHKKGISLSLKGNIFTQTQFLISLNKQKQKFEQLYTQVQNDSKKIEKQNKFPELSFYFNDSAFGKQNLSSTIQSNYSNSLLFSLNTSQMVGRQKAQDNFNSERLSKNLNQRVKEAFIQRSLHLKELVSSSYSSSSCQQKQKQKDKKFGPKQMIQDVRNSRTHEKQNLQNPFLNAYCQNKRDLDISQLVSYYEDSFYQIAKRQCINSVKSNFILSPEQRAQIIDRQTIVSHYCQDQTQQSDSFILDQSLVIQRQTLKNFIKAKVAIINEMYVIYSGVDMEQGHIVSIKQYQKQYRKNCYIQIEMCKLLEEKKLFQILLIKQVITDESNPILIKQGFQMTLEQLLKKCQNIQASKKFICPLLIKLLDSIQQKELILSQSSTLKDFVITKNQELKIQNPFILKQRMKKAKKQEQQYKSNQISQFLKSTGYINFL